MTLRNKARCLIAIGSNLGDSHTTVLQAIEALRGHTELRNLEASSLHQSTPVGGPGGQSEFSNAVVAANSSLAPLELLTLLQTLEDQFGRVRGERWAARTLDLDLLLVGGQIVDTPALCLPHPRMSFRPFVLDPAVEVAGDWAHPLLGASLSELHRRLHSGDDAVMVYGGSDEDRQWYAEQVRKMIKDARLVDQSSEANVLAVGSGLFAAPRLAIHLQTDDSKPCPGIPTLTVRASARGEVLSDVHAAIACVWPDLCSGQAEG